MKNILEALLKNLKEIFSDIDGDLSSKRMITFTGVIIMIITWICNLWFNMVIAQYIFDGFLYLVVVGLGVTASEKFSSTARKVKTTIKDLTDDK